MACFPGLVRGDGSPPDKAPASRLPPTSGSLAEGVSLVSLGVRQPRGLIGGLIGVRGSHRGQTELEFLVEKILNQSDLAPRKLGKDVPMKVKCRRS